MAGNNNDLTAPCPPKSQSQEAGPAPQPSSMHLFFPFHFPFSWSHHELEQGAKHSERILHVLVGWALCPASSELPALAGGGQEGKGWCVHTSQQDQTAPRETPSLTPKQPPSAVLTIPKINLFFHYRGCNNSNYGNGDGTKKIRDLNLRRRIRDLGSIEAEVHWRRRYKTGEKKKRLKKVSASCLSCSKCP